jgi:hypothetical protein
MDAIFPAFPPIREDTAVDYDALLRANLIQVFSETDPATRLAALQALWTADGVLFEQDHLYMGHEAISDSIGALLETLPKGMMFAPEGPAVGHHGVGRLRWRATSANGVIGQVSGTDIAIVKDNRIAHLYVMLEP